MKIQEDMRCYFKEQWINNPEFKKWNNIKATDKTKKCTCKHDLDLVELIDHDSCSRGRIDTVICTRCDAIKSYKIIR